MSTHQFLWLDLETTGLLGDGPEGPKPGDLYGDGKLLEWALVLAEDDRDGTLAEVAAYTNVVAHDVDTLPLDDFVRRMHTKNGLLADVAKAEFPIEAHDDFLAGVCKNLGAKPRSCFLAGNSVHFDLAWCRVHLPRFASYLSHRVFDVSTLIAAMRVWGPGLPKGEPAHRALDDVRESLASAKAFKRAVGWLP